MGVFNGKLEKEVLPQRFKGSTEGVGKGGSSRLAHVQNLRRLVIRRIQPLGKHLVANPGLDHLEVKVIVVGIIKVAVEVAVHGDGADLKREKREKKEKKTKL